MARQGYHLLTGAGDGVMGVACEAYIAVGDRAGQAIGIVPSLPDDPLHRPIEGYPNPWVEIPIYTHLDQGSPLGDEPTSRNHINILTSTVVVLLPGGEGTASEARLSAHYGKPAVAYLHAPDELPGLPPSIPIEATFSGVTSFVQRQLRRVSP